MEIRGERKCRNCGTNWSYYETGSIACPMCGSIKSVGLGDRKMHTAGGMALDLGPIRDAIDDEPITYIANRAATMGRKYRRSAGFVDAGELRPLDNTYLLATELETVGTHLQRSLQVNDTEEAYFLSLLRAPESGDRPSPTAVPSKLQPDRALSVCRAINDYCADLKRIYTDPDKPLSRVLSSLRANRKRIEALDGDVEPREAERLVAAARDIYAYLVRDDETAIVRVDERLLN